MRHDVSVAELNRRLGRGVNFGNALDAPSEGAWGFRLTERYFDEVCAAGFDTIRLPVRWSAHAGDAPPYPIERAFAERVDWAVDNAVRRGLNVVLNVHHYDEMHVDPQRHTDRFVGLWGHIARRYADQSDRLYFELLNEPHDALTAEHWNTVLAKALAVVRESNPDRPVIVGPVLANDITALPALALPDDPRLIVTIHYYAPFEFTHQAAHWVPDADRWLGTTWGSDTDRAAVRADLAAAAEWAAEHGRPLFVGEFGAYSLADMDSRARWTAFVRAEIEAAGMSWAYWEFGADFGVFDPERDAWREPLRHALLGSERPNRTDGCGHTP